jgi:uncharacterized protein DUF2865
MDWTERHTSRWISVRALMSAAAMAFLLFPARAQQPQQPPQQPSQQQSPYCSRLETQLQAFDRSANDSGRADQLRKFEEAAAAQQGELDRQEATARRAGCERNSFLVLFSGQPAACGPLNNKIQQMKDNIERIRSDIERLRGDSSPERGAQRRAILVALSQNNCGAQYQQQVAATPPPQGGFFESLFGPKSVLTPGSEEPAMSGPSGTFRTLCVRTCDGFYYPISAATNASRFGDDEKACRASCPAAEVQLYSHRNPGEGINEAVSVATQQPYTALPNAFRYRTALDQSCSCRRPGETWSQALKGIEDPTVEQGDIVVNDQRAKQLSQPRVDAQGRPVRITPPAAARPDLRPSQPATATATTPAPAATASTATAPAADSAPAEEPSKPDPNRKVRSVGPPFLTGH